MLITFGICSETALNRVARLENRERREIIARVSGLPDNQTS
jgi:hypothetical protein